MSAVDSRPDGEEVESNEEDPGDDAAALEVEVEVEVDTPDASRTAPAGDRAEEGDSGVAENDPAIGEDDGDDDGDHDPPNKREMKSRTQKGAGDGGDGSAAASKAKLKHDKRKQLALARESAKRNRAARERGEGAVSAAKSLVLPYRAVRRIMKLDKANGTVQVEAAILATHAAELFVKKMAKESHRHAKQRGRNIIKYEDVAEARAANESLNFLDTLLP